MLPALEVGGRGGGLSGTWKQLGKFSEEADDNGAPILGLHLLHSSVAAWGSSAVCMRVHAFQGHVSIPDSPPNPHNFL